MRILAQCPGCGGKIELNIRSLDRRQRCENCGRLFKVPDAQELRKALEIAGQANQSLYVDKNGRIYG